MVGRLAIIICVPLVFFACADFDRPAHLDEKRPENVAHEVVTVDLSKDDGPVTHRASGFVRGVSIQQPGDLMIRPLHPLSFRQPAADSPAKYGAIDIASRAKSLGVTHVFTVLSGSIRFDGAYPGEHGNLDRWLAGVDQLVRRAKAENLPVVWEIWDEPNIKESWKGSRDQYHSLWVQTFRKIRSIDPKAIIAGPSIDHWDQGYIDSFDKVVKDYNAQPDIICWHEREIRPDIAGHIGGLENSEWQDGMGVPWPKMAIHTVSEKWRFHPGVAVFFMASIERSKAIAGLRQGFGEHGVQIDNLLTDDFHPRALWWAYRAYADLEGRMILFSRSSTIDGVASWDEKSKSAQFIIGRSRETMGTTKPAKPKWLGDVELHLTHVRASVAHVIARRLPTAGSKALEKPVEVLNEDILVRSQELRFVLPDFEDGDAYLVNIYDLRNANPTTQSPASQP